MLAAKRQQRKRHESTGGGNTGGGTPEATDSATDNDSDSDSDNPPSIRWPSRSLPVIRDHVGNCRQCRFCRRAGQHADRLCRAAG